MGHFSGNRMLRRSAVICALSISIIYQQSKHRPGFPPDIKMPGLIRTDLIRNKKNPPGLFILPLHQDYALEGLAWNAVDCLPEAYSDLIDLKAVVSV